MLYLIYRLLRLYSWETLDNFHNINIIFAFSRVLYVDQTFLCIFKAQAILKVEENTEETHKIEIEIILRR